LYYHLVEWGVLPLGDPAEARDVFLAVRAALAQAHSYSIFGAGVMLGLGGPGLPDGGRGDRAVLTG